MYTQTFTATTTDYDHRDDSGRLDFPAVSLDVRFVRRSWGGYSIRRADNGRELGWIVRGTFESGRPAWELRVASQAFRGTGPADTGHLLDRVPLHLFNGTSQIACNPVRWTATKQEAADELLSHLHRHRAPAAGDFGAHYSVTPYRA